MVEIKVKRLNDEAIMPARAYRSDAGIDIYSNNKRVIITPNSDPTLVSTGIAVEIPLGYELQIRPRSGLAARGLTINNAPGTIDAGYRGEIKVIFSNTGKNDIILDKGDKIAQMVLNEIPDSEILEVDNLEPSPRGKRGFGSTGGFKAEDKIQKGGDWKNG